MNSPSSRLAVLFANPLPLLFVAALFFAAVFVFFYPSYFLSGDEHQYLQNAEILSQGKISVENNGLYCGGRVTGSNEMVPAYPIGRALVNIPFLIGGLDTVFFSGLLLHLLAFLLLILIFRRLHIHPAFALLYLFFPAFQWEARTLYSELGVLVVFLGAYYAWLSSSVRTSFATGFLLGLAVFFRVDALVGFGAFLAQAFISERKRVPALIAGFLVPLVLLGLFNLMVYGSLFSLGTGSTSILGRNFGLNLLVELFTFPILLFIVLPFSLLALRRAHPHRVLFVCLTAFTCILLVRFFSFWALEISLPHLFTVRLRYFVPLLGMLLIPVAAMYQDWFRATIKKWSIPANVLHGGAVVLLLLMGIGTIFLHATHQKLLDSRAQIQEKIHTLIPADATVIGSSDDCVYFSPELFGKKYYYKVTDLPTTFSPTPSTYVVDVAYSSQSGGTDSRQDVVDAERQKIKDFIHDHAGELEKVGDFSGSSTLHVWKFREAGSS